MDETQRINRQRTRSDTGTLNPIFFLFHPRHKPILVVSVAVEPKPTLKTTPKHKNNARAHKEDANRVYLNRTYLYESCILYDLDFAGLFRDIFKGTTSFVNVGLHTDEPTITG